MNNNNKNINEFDQFFKDKLGDADIRPPDFIWQKIEQQLPPQKKKRRGAFWLFLLLGLLAGGGSALTYQVIKHNQEQNSTTAVANTEKISSTHTQANQTDKQQQQTEQLTSNLQTNKDVNDNNKNADSPDNKQTQTNKKIASADLINSTELNKKQQTREQHLEKFKAEDNTTTDDANKKQAQNLNNKKQSTASKIKKQHSTNAGSNNYTYTAATQEPKESASHKLNKAKQSSVENQNTTNELTAANTTIPVKDALVPNEQLQDKKSNPVKKSTEDLTQPFVEPIRNAQEDQLLASNVPVKQMLTPIPSRDALRSLIEPSKLENLDMASNAGINDLNPNKDKQLRNLKQFTGYNINRGFHIGAFISINNVWLSNKNYSKSESATSIKPKITFGKSYGLNVGYDFKDRWGITSEIQYSEQGQKYSERNNYGLSTKEVKLNYVQVPVLIKYKNSFINTYNSKPIMFSVLFGPQFSNLVKKEVLLNNQSANSNPYNKIQGGLMAGIDFDLYMTRYMYMTIGARTGFGTSFKKNTPLNYQIGITTQFNFRVPKKIK